MLVAVKKTHPSAILPSKQTEGAAGYDLCCVEDFTISAGEAVLVNTGLALSIPLGYEAQIRPRSGLALKRGITVLNSPGTIDSDYRGDVGVLLWKGTPGEASFKKGDRIAQMVFAPVASSELRFTINLSETSRGTQGFGHTGGHTFPETETFEDLG